MRMLVATLFMFIACPAYAQGALTLGDALRRAEEVNPALLTARAGLHAAEAEAREAGRLLNANPELTVERAKRTIPEPGGFENVNRDSAIGIAQTFEVAGQQQHRRAAASRELEAIQAEVSEARLRIRAEVEQQFFQVVLLQRRLEAELENAKLAEEAASSVSKRVAAGEDSRLDGNLAKVEADRARNAAEASLGLLLEARAKLAALLQLPAGHAAEVVGELEFSTPRYSLEALLRSAAERPHLRALALRSEAARSRLALERAAVIPDVTVALTSAREGPAEFRERVTTLSVTLPLPLFKRNDAAIGRARAEVDKAQIEQMAASLDAQAQVRSLWERLQSAERRVRRLGDSVQRSLEENLTLSTKAFRAGEIGIVQLVLVNRQVLDARRDYLDALTEYVHTRVALEQAAGWTAESANASPHNPTR